MHGRAHGCGGSLPRRARGCIRYADITALLELETVYLHFGVSLNKASTNQYVDGKKPKINDTRDQYLRKNVVTRRIETSSSSGGSSHHSGGHGGSHRSSSGVSHGGGGNRK